MELRPLGATDTRVTPMAVGCWVMGGDMWADPNDDESISAIEAALDAGLNFIDTAPAYGFGRSERVVGQAIRGRHDDIVIATKCGLRWDPETREFPKDSSREWIRQEVDDALERIGVDAIDLMQVHWPDPERPIAEPIEALARAQEQGKIKHIGVSNFSVEQMDEARKVTELASLQPPFSAFRRGIEAEILPYCIEHNLAVLPYSPLERGVLTGKFHLDGVAPADDLRKNHAAMSPEQFEPTRDCLAVLRKIAQSRGTTLAAMMIAWTIAQPGITSVLVGVRRPSQVADNIAGAELELTEDELAGIDAALTRRTEAIAAAQSDE